MLSTLHRQTVQHTPQEQILAQQIIFHLIWKNVLTRNAQVNQNVGLLQQAMWTKPVAMQTMEQHHARLTLPRCIFSIHVLRVTTRSM